MCSHIIMECWHYNELLRVPVLSLCGEPPPIPVLHVDMCWIYSIVLCAESESSVITMIM